MKIIRRRYAKVYIMRTKFIYKRDTLDKIIIKGKRKIRKETIIYTILNRKGV